MGAEDEDEAEEEEDIEDQENLEEAEVEMENLEEEEEDEVDLAEEEAERADAEEEEALLPHRRAKAKSNESTASTRDRNHRIPYGFHLFNHFRSSSIEVEC